ncbi:MAG: DUF4440 domain-containing protein [Proteobacteria bacterium]|nr:DUF4440 domain-containing protein [Pseudomonadota bacterium]
MRLADAGLAADTAKRGVDGWVAAFAPAGAMLRATGRIAMSERGAIGAAMRELLEGGVLAWAPIASRVHGDLGFTIGKATYVRRGETRVDWRSNYTTIWQRQPDQTWKVLFDVGRLINER